MTYAELKQWFDEWLSELPDQPIPLVLGDYGITRDVRVSIDIHFRQIENTPIKERKRSAMSRASKAQLIKIKQHIEEGNHDISSFGYTHYSNFKPNK